MLHGNVHILSVHTTEMRYHHGTTGQVTWENALLHGSPLPILSPLSCITTNAPTNKGLKKSITSTTKIKLHNHSRNVQKLIVL